MHACIFAQEITIDMPNSRGFSGVQSIDSEIIFTTWFGEKTETKGMANFVLNIYDKELKEIKSTEIEVTKYSEITSAAFTGEYFLFIFVDMMKKNRTMVTFDKTGELIKKNVEEDVKRALLVPENFPIIHVLNSEEFLLVRPMKDKKFGYDIERLDKDLESKWTKTYIPETGVYTAIHSQAINNKLYVLKEENPNRSSSSFTYSVQCFNADDGELNFETSLSDKEDGGAPAFIRVDEKDMVLTGGTYFKGSKYDDKNSDGLFLAVINQKGDINSFTKKSWEGMKSKIQGEFSSALLGGKTKMMVQDIIRKKEGGFMVIAEQFKKANNANLKGTGMGAAVGGSKSTSTGPEVGFTVLDFVFFHFDDAGNLGDIDVIEKLNKEARVTGKIASEKGLAIANFMKEKEFFSYKEVIEHNGNQVILFRNDDGFKSKLYFLPMGTKTTKGIHEVDMDRWVTESMNKLGKLAKATGGSQYTFNSDASSNDYALYKNARFFKPGFILMYDYNRSGLKVWLEPIPEM